MNPVTQQLLTALKAVHALNLPLKDSTQATEYQAAFGLARAAI